MPFWRHRFGTPLLVITFTIGLSILAVVFIGEGFWRDGMKLRKRDGIMLRKRGGSTIIFDVPWNPLKVMPSTPVKALDPVEGGLSSAVEAVASVLLGGGYGTAGNVQGEVEALTETVIPVSIDVESGSSILGGQTQIESAVADATSAMDSATGVVGGIVSAGSTIVPSVLAGALNASSIGGSSMERSMASGPSRQSSTSESHEFLPQTGLSTTCRNSSSVAAISFNVTATPLLSSTSEGTGLCTTCKNSSSVTAFPFNITTAPSLSSKSVFPMATNCTSKPTSTSCPSPATETSTVTETWHSTHYAETATYFSFISAPTFTCTETISVCPSLTAHLPPSTTLPMQSSLIACVNGFFAKRAEDCLGKVASLVYTSIASSNTTPVDTSTAGLNNTGAFNSIACPSIPSSHAGASQTSSHPCPNAGFSCSECPDGWFCPPSQTAPQSAPCGFGWACGACSGGWFCIPSPTYGRSGPVKSVASLLSEVSAIVTQATSTVASFTAHSPSLASAHSMTLTTARSLTITFNDGSEVIRSKDCLDGILGATSSLCAFGTAATIITQATSLAGRTVEGSTSVLNPALSDVSSALAQVNSLIGGLLSTVLVDMASALQVANSLGGNLQPAAASTSIVDGGDVNTPAPAEYIISTKVSSIGDGVGGNVIPTASAAGGGNVAGLVGSNAGFVGTNAGGLIAAAGDLIRKAPGLIAEARAGDRMREEQVEGEIMVHEVEEWLRG